MARMRLIRMYSSHATMCAQRTQCKYVRARWPKTPPSCILYKMKSAPDEAADGLANAPDHTAILDTKAVRAATGKTQIAFAEAYDLPLRIVQAWEEGREHPDGGAITLLKMIEADPVAVERFVGKIK